jgi:hypothetical protein
MLSKMKTEYVFHDRFRCAGFILTIHSQLIPYFAQHQASQPATWGSITPTTEQVAQLANAFTAEWTWAIDQMMRHWDQPPAR